jgi:hypothetical protein
VPAAALDKIHNAEIAEITEGAKVFCIVNDNAQAVAVLPLFSAFSASSAAKSF